ncbi:succinyl transferase OpgC [Gordonia sp. TBRC 11910]|uniref:Succinyl transferase OpgC n=2 Tax=Gordonia asplenii TaxID=2725283 RepID=A0A848KYI8_9ACTN|nr:succinyl transferase OpgC [Gordonia asplenii]
MVSEHFANGTLLAAPTHAFPYVDGMSAFVLLSGLVLGMVYSGWIERYSLRYAYRRLLRRVAVLYVCQLSISLVAVAAAFAGHRWLTLLPMPASWADGIVWATTMRYLPSGGNILLLYMLLLISAFALFPMLMRNWWQAVLVASTGLYVYAQIHSPTWFYITSSVDGAPVQNWAAWQFMFVPAVVVGWKWRTWQVAERIVTYLPFLAVGAIGLWLALHFVIDDGPWRTIESEFADKVDFAPARAVGAWVLIPTIYGMFGQLLAWWHHDWLRPLVMTGSRSLDSYVLQAIALVVVPIHVAHRPWDLLTVAAVTLLVFGACWGWAELRRGLGIAKLHQAPAMMWRRRG